MMKISKGVCFGAFCEGIKLQGYDIGALSKISLFGVNGARKVIKVSGHTRTLNRFAGPEYIGPEYYLIDNNYVVGNIIYDKYSALEAKGSANTFLYKPKSISINRGE